jgi:hypothetical protein
LICQHLRLREVYGGRDEDLIICIDCWVLFHLREIIEAVAAGELARKS